MPYALLSNEPSLSFATHRVFGQLGKAEVALITSKRTHFSLMFTINAFATLLLCDLFLAVLLPYMHAFLLSHFYSCSSAPLWVAISTSCGFQIMGFGILIFSFFSKYIQNISM